MKCKEFKRQYRRISAAPLYFLGKWENSHHDLRGGQLAHPSPHPWLSRIQIQLRDHRHSSSQVCLLHGTLPGTSAGVRAMSPRSPGEFSIYLHHITVFFSQIHTTVVCISLARPKIRWWQGPCYLISSVPLILGALSDTQGVLNPCLGTMNEVKSLVKA